MNTFKTPKGTELPFLNLKGKDYLQVAHRIVWFREAHPDWRIQTSIVKFDDNFALMEASIIDSAGNVLATGHKAQTAKGFPGGYLEKAEAGAVGRALAFLGYGTAFAQELEEDGTNPSALADSPLSPPPAPKLAKGPESPVSEAQLNRLYAIARDRKWAQPTVKQILQEQFNLESSKDLTRKQYDELIKILETGFPEGNIK